jgi:hypothetical protein
MVMCHNSRLMHAYVEISSELKKKLPDLGGEDALKHLAKLAVNATETELDIMEIYNRSWICAERRRTLRTHYDARLKSRLEGTGINVSTDVDADSDLGPFCQCPDHLITGRSLRLHDLTVVTKQHPGEKSTTLCESRCYRKTSKETASIVGPPYDLPSAQVGTINRFLKTLDTEMSKAVNTLPIDEHLTALKHLGPKATSNQVYAKVIHDSTKEEPYCDMDHILLDPTNRIDAKVGDVWSGFQDEDYVYSPVGGTTVPTSSVRERTMR